jgi:hypothetical protein
MGCLVLLILLGGTFAVFISFCFLFTAGLNSWLNLVVHDDTWIMQ